MMRPTTLMTTRSSASSSTNNTSGPRERRGTRLVGRFLNGDENFGKKRSQRRSHNNNGDSDDVILDLRISDEAETIKLSRSKEEDKEEDKTFEERLKTTAISVCAALSVSSVACVDPALAGFGAPTGAVLSPPVNTIRMDKLEKMSARR